MILALLAALFTALYLAGLPSSVQSGDTAELVAAAWNNWVAHPPGYPLWSGVQGLWLHATPWGSVFWRAAFLNTLFGVSTLVLIGFPVRKSPWVLFFLLLPLGLSGSFLEASLLPDVFSLHALITGAIGSLFLFGSARSPARCFLLPFLFLLGMANHQSIVLLSPVLLALAFETQPSERKYLYLGTLAGAGGLLFLYFSLFFRNPTHPESWGMITTFPSLLGHFLRVDFGTLRLAPHSHPASLSAFLGLLRSLWLELGGLFVITVFSLFRKPPLLRDPRLLGWGASSILCLLFFLVLNVEDFQMGAEVLLRFHVLPTVALTLLCGYLLRTAKPSGRLLLLGLLFISPSVLWGLSQLPERLSLRSNRTVETYLKDLLTVASREHKPVLLIKDDPTFFGLKYMQGVLGFHPEIPTLQPYLLKFFWYAQKHPFGSIPLPPNEPQLIRNLLATHSVLVTDDFPAQDDFHLRFLSLGRNVQTGQGFSFGEPPSRFPEAALPTGPQAFSRTYLLSQYAIYPLRLGDALMRQGNTAGAIEKWELAARAAPFLLDPVTRLCNATQNQHSSCQGK